MNIIGVDPGKTGGLAVIPSDRKNVQLYQFEDMTDRELHKIVHAQMMEDSHCFFEKVHAMPKQGVSTSFEFGKNTGFLLGLLTACYVPYEEVSPQTWQRTVKLGRKQGTQYQRKKAHLNVAQKLFPQIESNIKTADALLIAEHGWRQFYRQ